MELLAAASLGLVQGLSEFLPVSSSGHLIVGRALLGWDLDRFGLPFDVACHVGTLIAVTAFFARDVRAMVMALRGALMGRPGEYERLIRLIAIGCRDAAARFVFLLSLPAVTAAAAKEGLELSDVGMEGVPVTLLAVGLVTSAMVGYLTIRLFLRYLANHSLAVFAHYRFALKALTLLWLLTRGGGGA